MRSIEGADDGAPGAPVEGNVTEPRSGFHVGNARSRSAARAGTRCRLAVTDDPLLIHQETEENHLSLSDTKSVVTSFGRFR
ncbi:hypothetical protein MRB53_022440 [Persea americana]|uniref:Uncharacterized protein n=1 Tax=Persea americana TaxID=3435 RepID=A0ACC2L7P1_PERAE|nr:hypothetical protein MRB53_022440 [Persea americana]